MNYRVIITDPAWHDIREAKEWYESQREGLGRRYWVHVKLALRTVRRSPLLGPPSGQRQLRKRNLLVFPYSVYYEIVGPEIRVHAVWHGARKPATLKERLS